MSDVTKFNGDLFSEWSLMTLSDYKDDIKFDKLLNFASDQKEIAVKTVEKLDKVQNTLDVAVGSVVERRNNIDDKNYLCILRLKYPKIKNNKTYDYYVIRCTGVKTLNTLKCKITYEKVVCTISLNYAINSWEVIATKLKNETEIATYRNYFFILKNIFEKYFENIFRQVLSDNRNRVTN